MWRVSEHIKEGEVYQVPPLLVIITVSPISRRDKIMNYFTVMVKKRLKNDEDIDDDVDGLGPKEKKKGGKKKKSGGESLVVSLDVGI